MKNGHMLTYKPYGMKDSLDVIFTKTLSSNLINERIQNYKRALFIADAAIIKSFTELIISLFRKIGYKTRFFPFIYGPKSLENLSLIWQEMVNFVPDLVVGIGGGTVSDLTGFAASTYQRGIPHILFPTTVLGMIDASLGGKTAIDFGGIKNSVGAIHYPILVVNIIDILKTLPSEEFFSGLAEAIKAAVLFDRPFFRQLQIYADIQDFSYKNPKLPGIMKHSAYLKMKNSEDPPNHKIKLLYGHAIGQALELYGKKRLKHGEAVAIGMTIEGAIAVQLGIWNKEQWQEQTELIKKFHLPITLLSGILIKNLIQKMKLYKKLIKEKSFGFIFPIQIGKVSNKNKSFLTYISENKIEGVIENALALVQKEA